MKNCERIKKHLVEYVDNDLPSRQLEEVSRHLAHCAECNKDADRLELNLMAVKSVMEAEGRAVEGLSVVEYVMADIRGARREPAPLRRYAALAASFVLFAFAVGAGFYYGLGMNEIATQESIAEPALVIKLEAGKLDMEDRVAGTVRTVNVRP